MPEIPPLILISTFILRKPVAAGEAFGCRAWLGAAEYRDDDTGHHIIRVGRYVYLIARELGFTEDQADLLAAQLHDVGKIGIPDAVLLNLAS